MYRYGPPFDEYNSALMRKYLTLTFLALFMILSACSNNPSPEETPTADAPAPESGETSTPFQPDEPDTPTATAVVPALTVSGVPISMDEFQASLARFQQAYPETSTEEALTRVPVLRASWLKVACYDPDSWQSRREYVRSASVRF